jgi:hypothetical protein
MRQFLAIAVLSVLVFIAGYGVRIWVDDTRALPLPPPLGGEFAANNRPAPAAGDNPSTRKRRDDLVAQIERLRPQIEAYRKGLAQIDADFDRDLVALLTPVQHDRYNERHRRRAAQSGHLDNTGPLTDQEIMWLHDRPSWNALDHISVQWKLDDLNNDIKFDDAQYAKVRELLNQRRDNFLRLVDSVPLPSLELSQLAPVVQRLGQPKQP